MKIRKIIFNIISILTILLIFTFVYSQEPSREIRKLIVFYSPTCHKCIQVKNELMPQIEKEFKDKILLEYLDITDIQNYKLLLSLQEKYKVQIKHIWPVFYFEGYFLNGKGQIKNRLQAIITKALHMPLKSKQGLPPVDLISHFKALTPFIVVSAGLLDGINPCAFTVVVFLFLFWLSRDIKKEN